MFGKKILSIVGLLFISSVKAECIYETALIKTGDCVNGSYLVNEANNEKIADAAGASVCTNDDKCNLITCVAGGSCEKQIDVTGYVTLVDTLFVCTNGECEKINTEGAFINALNPTKPIKCTTVSCIECDEFCATNCGVAGNVYYSSGHNYFCPTTIESDKIEIVAEDTTIYHYFKVGNSEDSPLTGENNDSGDDIKELYKTGNGATVLDVISNLTENTKAYLVTDINTDMNNGKTIVVKYDGSALENQNTVEDDLCVRNAVVTQKLDSYCRYDCDYYSCTTAAGCSKATIQRRTVVSGVEIDVTKCKPSVAKPSVDIGTTDSSYHCLKGYYIQNGVALFTTGNDPVTGNLYYCPENNGESCQEIIAADAQIGYYRSSFDATHQSKVKYIQCDGSECKAVFTADAVCSNAGDLIDASGLKLCSTDSGTVVPLSNGTSGKYFVATKTNGGNIFSDKAVNDYNVIIEIDADKAVLATKASRKYKYTSKNGLKIFEKTDAEGICETPYNIDEYELYQEPEGALTADEYDYYKKGQDFSSS